MEKATALALRGDVSRSLIFLKPFARPVFFFSTEDPLAPEASERVLLVVAGNDNEGARLLAAFKKICDLSDVRFGTGADGSWVAGGRESKPRSKS